MDAMRIGIDCRTMLDPEQGERAGVGHYTSYLVKSLVNRSAKDEFVLFFDHRMPNTELVKELRERKNVEMHKFPYSEYKRYLPFGYSHVVVANALKKATLDLFHSPAYVIPLQYRGPSVITVHDLAIYKDPNWFPPKQGFSTKVAVPNSVKKADRVIAVSEATAKMARELFDVPEEKVNVVYEGFEKGKRVNKSMKNKIKKALDINDRYLFFVGTIEPRKNIINLVQAFDKFMNANFKRHRDLQLVIAGGKGWKHEDIFRAIARAKWSSNIRVPGYITHEEKIALLEDSLFFVFPSLWEGFGLPVLEAASMGVPVLTSKVSSLPEVGGPGAHYVNPESVRSIQTGITTMVRSASKRQSLAKKGKEHAKQFTWARCAKDTAAVYKEVYEEVFKEA